MPNNIETVLAIVSGICLLSALIEKSEFEKFLNKVSTK